MSDAPVDPFLAARGNLRDTVKWLAAALAGVLAVAVGSSPLTALGSLNFGEDRFWMAAGGLAAALVSFLFGLSLIFRLLVGDVFLMENAIQNDDLKDKSLEPMVKPLLPVGDETFKIFLAEYRSAQTAYRTASGDKAADAYRTARQTLLNLVPVYSSITSLLHFNDFRNKVRCAQLQLLACAVIGAVALALFAWAANPPKPEPKTVILRVAAPPG